MTTPGATYRLQLRNGMTFARAAAIAPYLQQLGISHVYLSPIFRSVPGSTHGYDAADFNEIDPELGGASGFADLTAALREHGLKTIVDVVPNHMGASPANPWWRDVLEWGVASPYARHFDVDWSAPKLIVPALGKAYGEALAAGELTLGFNAAAGEFTARYYDLELPLTPPSYATILTLADAETLAELARRFAASSPDNGKQLCQDLAEIAGTTSVARSIETALASLAAGKHELHAILEAQIWRMAHWRASRESLTYRRFFEISDLVGVRVEQPRVFDDVHRTILDLVRAGQIDGLRIDHVDGVADPLGYLQRLRTEAGDATYIVVEKILGAGEDLRPQWPVQGTTGYEFIRDVSSLFIADCEPALSHAYATYAGHETDVGADAVLIKRRTITRNLAGELDVLVGQALELARGDVDTRDYGPDTLRRAIIELAAHLAVYRTYVDTSGASPEDLAVLDAAATSAKASREVEDEAAVDLIVRYVTLGLDEPERQVEALAFTTRFQQTTGPLMAKAMEDTLFYRFNRLIALNEVGGEPANLKGDAAAFHRAMIERQAKAPRALTATATHDTKRGEDARCRIYAISEMPDVWSSAVDRWSAQLAPHRGGGDASPIPEPEMEWLFYQSLLGAWPMHLDAGDAESIAELEERLVAFMRKAAREAKLHTSWTQPDDAYEGELETFVRAAFASRPFLNDFASVSAPLLLAGAISSLAQLAIKLFAPGVPDLYQGCEFWDLSLVDPDNRRAVDFAARQHALAAPAAAPASLLRSWPDAAIKLHVLRCGLALRASIGDAIYAADYVPLRVEGRLSAHVIAYARLTERHAIIVVASRLALGLLHDAAVPHIAAALWQDTVVRFPKSLNGITVQDVLTQNRHALADERIAVSAILSDLPVALLSAERTNP